ncbi:MAG TPA: GerMN domain-containing protein [Acidobacteriota bacterium]|nr:GerMN domain-containing protein [Acidobacteriota bacterium]
MSLLHSNERRRILLAVGLVAAASLITFLVFFFQSRDLQREEEPPSAAVADPEVLEAADQEDNQIELTLYLYRPSSVPQGRLVSIRREVARLEDPHLKARQIIGEVLRGSGQGPNVFPAEARLRQVYLLADGTAVVDLSQETALGLPGGAVSEYGALRSLTRSLRANLEEVKRVKFLVGGQDAPTFAGHVSISRPFSE